MRPSARAPDAEPQRPASGRESHSQKITVYLSASELLALERARLALRGYGIAVDRGRIVREALAVLLGDLDVEGDRSLVARRLRRPGVNGGKLADGIGAGGVLADGVLGDGELADGEPGDGVPEAG